MQQEYNVDYIWNSINDFWRMFEDAPLIEQLWRGYAFVVNNLYYQLYQLDLSKCIHTIPYKWYSDWEAFVLDDSTRITQDPPEYTTHPYSYHLPFGVKNVTILRESPRETVNLPPYTVLRTDGLLVTPDGTVRHPTDKMYIPNETVEMEDGTLVFPLGISVDCEKLYPASDYIVNENTKTIHFKTQPYPLMWSNLAVRDLEVIYENFGVLLKYYKVDTFNYLREVQGLWYAYWNGATITNLEIGINILKGLPFAYEAGFVVETTNLGNTAKIGNHVYEIDPDQLSYLQVGHAVESVNMDTMVAKIGGNYYRIKSTSIENMSVGDVVTELNALSTTVKIDETVYDIPNALSVEVYPGQYVDQFTKLTNAVGVYDYINYPGWWLEYTGTPEENGLSCYFNGLPTFDMGNFDVGTFDDVYDMKCLEIMFLQYFTFLVKINQNVWFRNKEEFQVVLAFLYAVKPAYTHFIFQLDFLLRDEYLTLDDESAGFTWSFAPRDIPCDFHSFDEAYIHPTFDDGAYFDFDRERDDLYITVWGSPHLFYDDCAIGFTFDDVAVPSFDFDELTFDQDPYGDPFVINMTLKIPGEVLFEDFVEIKDLGITPSDNLQPQPPSGILPMSYLNFVDNYAKGYSFDDPAAARFDYEEPFDSNTYNEYLTIEQNP